MSWLLRTSDRLLRLEKLAVSALVAALLGLILLNIVTRAAGAAIFWVDELAIYTMIWMALIGASAAIRLRTGVAVTLVTGLLPPGLRRLVARLVDTLVLGIAVAVLVLSIVWFDPVALAQSGFDFDEFAAQTFKFIYSEPTGTIGIRKFWVWLAVPAMAVNMTIHAAANLIEGPPDDSPSHGPDAAPESAGPPEPGSLNA